MSKVEPGGLSVKTRGTLTPEEDRKRQLEVTERALAEYRRAAIETAASHEVTKH